MTGKRLFSSYLSKELNDVIYFLAERDEVSKVVFVRRAIRSWMKNPGKINERILISKRSDPDYIERNTLFSTYLDEAQREQLKNMAEEKGCKVSQLFFQIMLDYCAEQIYWDGTGIEIKEQE